MQKLINIFFFLCISICTSAQNNHRPKLVVGIVVDQMRWDYLYRYYDRYDEKGGFKRLLKQGFTCENTLIPYAPTVTACGHSGIYTGSVPAITGITGNTWWDYQLNKSVYCSDDSSVETVGSNTVAAGKQSPRNLLVTTVCDELRLATNFKSKVIGIALKDRGSILPAGHAANAAYWYDGGSGNWITSTYYMKQLPQWVKDFNDKKLVGGYYKDGWKTLYPLNTYTQSTPDDEPYEVKSFGKGFPYDLAKFTGTSYGIIDATPFGNTLTAQMAMAAVNNEQLGADSVTDFLAISFSSTDYVGHAFGPNSVEIEDTYLRLDKDLGNLLDFLDTKVGKDQYVVFLSADHGAAHVPAFAKEHNIPAGNVDFGPMVNALNDGLKSKFGKDKLVLLADNYQFFLNLSLIQSSALNLADIKAWCISYLSTLPSVERAIDLENITNTTLNATIKNMLVNGYYPQRCGQIQVVLQPQWIESFLSGGTTHGVWNPYDAHIPLLWYGWGIKSGKTNRETYMTDIAPTIAALLHIQMPNGCVGKVIEEVMK